MLRIFPERNTVPTSRRGISFLPCVVRSTLLAPDRLIVRTHGSTHTTPRRTSGLTLFSMVPLARTRDDARSFNYGASVDPNGFVDASQGKFGRPLQLFPVRCPPDHPGKRLIADADLVAADATDDVDQIFGDRQRHNRRPSAIEKTQPARRQIPAIQIRPRFRKIGGMYSGKKKRIARSSRRRNLPRARSERARRPRRAVESPVRSTATSSPPIRLPRNRNKRSARLGRLKNQEPSFRRPQRLRLPEGQ